MLCAILVCAWAMIPRAADASCLASADPSVRQLETLVDQDASRAVRQAQSRLQELQQAAHPDARRVASLYAVLAQAYSILELDDDAKNAALAGLKLATAAGDPVAGTPPAGGPVAGTPPAGGPAPDDPVYLALLMTYAENVYDAAAMAAAAGSIDAAQTRQVKGSLADTCLLITRGLLQYRQERPDLAISSLTQAYHASVASGFIEARIRAAGVLSTVMRSTGDFTQALALNQEVIDWDTQQNATLALSVSRFLRGKILNLMGRYSAAIDEFTQARRLSVQLGDSQGIAFADLLDCSARIELNQWDRAATECGNALRVFEASHSADEVKETEVLLARIDLANGRADRALATLNQVLDHGGADLLPGRVASVYQWRARANAALRNYPAAYADLTEYTRRYAAANDAERVKVAAALRARFQTDREIERNSLLKHELGASREETQRQAQTLRWNSIVVALGAWVIALLAYFLLVNRRYRQQLLKLASVDSLTGLPNRRRTAELAMAALADAAATQQPLTLAIIDMDHFKIINDRCGHATGDFVLREFARVAREALRESDVLGRWGGEEFLLIMPDATLEFAMASLERMRTLVCGIRLPPEGAGLRVSLSAGLATSTSHGRSLDEMIARADSALYRAKHDGRNLVRIADENYLSTTAIRRAIRQ